MAHRSNPERILAILRPKLHRLVTDLWGAEGAARDFSDPEGVHQMRVATRRLRAALDTGNGLLTRKPERRIRSDVRELARALGDVRDGDVMIETLRSIMDDGMPHPGMEGMIERLNRQRESDRARLLAVLDELDANGARDRSLALFNDLPHDAKAIRRRDARELIRGPLAGFLAQATSIPAADDVDGLHRLRIDAKRLRYAVHLVETPLAPESTAIVGTLATMQDRLGDIHNSDVLIALIRVELHILLDETIASVKDGADRPDATRAASDDLLDLLTRTAQERQERYEMFATWWGDLLQAGFRNQLAALDTPRGKRRKA